MKYMRKLLYFKMSVLFLVIMLFLSGCGLTVNTGTGSSGANDGGIYRSSNKGDNWTQKTSILSVNRQRSFSGADILSLSMELDDSKAIYAGSVGNGLVYSYDGADSWQIAVGLGQVNVRDVAVDPAERCKVYAVSDNKVFKSSDCSRTWAQAYFDNDLRLKIATLAIDYINSANIFIGTSRGDLIKSSDAGATWRAISRFSSQVEKIAINPVDAKIMFIGTANDGVFRSLDGGASWESLEENLKAFDNSTRFRDFTMVKSEKSTIFLATSYGLLKSTDLGSSWTEIKLLTPEKQATINSIAVNPNNANEIYYVTNTTFYRSLDGGQNWSSKKLPTGRAGAKLLLDPKNTATIYLAVRSQ